MTCCVDAKHATDRSVAGRQLNRHIPGETVQVTLANGSKHLLKVSGQRCTSGAQPGFYALIQGQDRIFLLNGQATAKLNVSLDDLE